MNTPLIHWQQYNRPLTSGTRRPALNLYPYVAKGMSYLVSVLTVIAIVTGAAWLINDPALVIYLQVAIWTSGLVFIGLAIEAENLSTAWLSLATGFALPALAWLSTQMGPEMLVVAVLLIATWLASAIFQFSRTANR